MAWASANLATILALVLATVFAVAGIVNLSGAGTVRDDFARWGYPAGFHLVCGGIELVGAALLLWPASRLGGLTLLGAVMAIAVVTLLHNREPLRHLAPALGISVLLTLAATVLL